LVKDYSKPSKKEIGAYKRYRLKNRLKFKALKALYYTGAVFGVLFIIIAIYLAIAYAHDRFVQFNPQRMLREDVLVDNSFLADAKVIYKRQELVFDTLVTTELEIPVETARELVKDNILQKCTPERKDYYNCVDPTWELLTQNDEYEGWKTQVLSRRKDEFAETIFVDIYDDKGILTYFYRNY
jgi:hypothetical protein